MRILRTTFFVALLAGIAATLTSVPSGDRAVAAAACPLNVMLVCVVEKSGFKHVSMTNACYARQWGARVLHPGTC
jgi:hypothetical protein